jgi:hypothetical protein
MVTVDAYDACRIIESLSAQIRNKSPNTGRTEFWAEIKDEQGNVISRRAYFSISVDPPV